MKTRLLIFSSLFFVSLITVSQSKVNLVVFSEDGDKFYAFVNGIKQNANAESNVKVTNIPSNVSLRIEFEDKALPQLKQNMPLQPGFEHTMKIKRDMKKQLKLRYFGQEPLDNGASNTVPTVAYHTSEAAPQNNSNTTTTQNNYNTSTTTQDDAAPPTKGGNTTITTTSTKTQVNNNQNPNDISVNMTVGGAGINMNISGLDDMDSDNNGTVTKTTTSTTVTSSSSSSSPKHTQQNTNQQYNTQTTVNYPTETQTAPPVSSGCRGAMTTTDFDKMKQSVSAKPFSDTKMSTAKIATKNNCLSTNQVKEICKLFSMDDDKLAYAKFAHEYCIDKGNFYQVSEVFSFSTTTDELNAFLEKN